jgi:mono/diheme cytochrome c family protein
MADKKHTNPTAEPFIVWSRVPSKIIWVVIILASLSFVPLSLVYAHRNLNWRMPRTSIIPDMDNQYRFNAQQANPDFADGRVMRSWVKDTVPVGMLREDDHFYRGTTGEYFATDFPAQIIINDELIARGEDRYTIYCSACHGQAGYGDGMIDKRASELMQKGQPGMAWVNPLSYHSEEMRNRPVGHIFNTISNGIRTMSSYKSQISVEDRWAIVAYIRALQISQWTEVTDVDQQFRESLIKQINAARNNAPAAPVGETAPPADAAAVGGSEAPAGADDGSQAGGGGNQADAVGGNG